METKTKKMNELKLLTLEKLKTISGGEPTSETSFGYDIGRVLGTLCSYDFWEGWVMDTFH
jgi:hypothetical protein